MSRRPLARGAAVVAICLLATGLLVVPASGGDNVAIFSFEPDEGELAAGETIEVDVVFSSHGGYDGSGVIDFDATVAYDADRLAVTDVEAGPWFEEGGTDADVNAATDVDEESGEILVEQSLEPADEGVTNAAPIATITFSVAEGADDGVADLEFASSGANTTAYPQHTIDRSAEIAVEGDAAGNETGETDEPIPGFGVAAALIALLLAVAFGRHRLR